MTSAQGDVPQREDGEPTDADRSGADARVDLPVGARLTLPRGCELVRTTPEFDQTNVPTGLLRAHRIAGGVWGRLLVRSGSIRFGFEHDDTKPADTKPADTNPTDREWVLSAGDHQVIPPGRLHHVRVDGPVCFVVEFLRPPVP